MKITFTAKEIAATITDEHNNVVLDYKAENYKVAADMDGLLAAAVALMAKITEDEALS